MASSLGRIAAIETQYKGYRFRSRLEARWAVFFDALGIRWEYELEGFDLPDAGRYLPDFYLPGSGVFFEVKGEKPTDDETLKAYVLARETGKPVVIACGMLDYDRELLREAGFSPTYDFRIYFAHHRPSGSLGCFAYFFDYTTGLTGPDAGMQYHFSANNIPWPGFDGTDASLREIARLDSEYVIAKYGKPHQRWMPFRGFVHEERGGFCHEMRPVFGIEGVHCSEIIGAINAMRSARFEHGQVGAAA
jgi:hypothetical protein